MGLVKKKTFLLPEDKLRTVKQFLGARSETEAVIFSLEEVLWRRKLQAFLQQRPWKGFQLTQAKLSKMRRE